MFDSWKIDSQGAAGFSRNRYLLAVFGTLALAALAALTAIAVLAPSARAVESNGPDVEPTLLDGPPNTQTCAEEGYAFGFKPQPEPPPSGTYNFPGGIGETVTITNVNSFTFNWVSTLGIDAVIVKGGNDSNAYIYDPPGPEQMEDDGLKSPLTPSGQQSDISHIEFCYDFELEVSKTANTTFTRDYDWDIAKTCDKSVLEVSAGQSYNMTCDVTVSLLGDPTDSDWAVSGDITVHNPAPVAAAGVNVTDAISGYGDADVLTCDGDGTTNRTIPALGDLTCHYSADLPDGSGRTNTATASASTTPGINGGSGSANVTFGDPTTEKDDCVDVTDDKIGPLGQVCVDDLDENDEYTFEDVTYTIGPPETDECGEFDSTNTATFTTNTPDDPAEEDDTGSASHTVTVTVVGCNGDGGCTLTQGYWKTHSEKGPAPYDNTWAQLSNGAYTTFFLSGKTYYQVLWTPPAGNPYYTLAKQYIAAQLNQLNGATLSGDALAAFNTATGLFTTKTPAQIGALAANNALRKQFVTLASTLDKYNNGVIGPGHCSEDATSSTSA